MTNYTNTHVYGSGPSRESIKRQAKRAKRKSQWATKNPERLLSPEQLSALLKGK